MAETPDQSTSCGTFLTGLLLGAAAGAVVALLYAPQSGEKTREQVVEKLDDLKTRMEAMTATATEMAQTRLREAKADLSEAVQATRVAAAEKAAALRRQTGLD